jgi:hypothetical protein
MGMVRSAVLRTALGFVFASSCPGAFARECNPDQLVCGIDPYTYQCPPCPPRGVADSSSAAPSGLGNEQYRRSLESYLDRLEHARERDPDGPLIGYREGVQRYREGITLYRQSVRVQASRPE